MIEDDLCRVKDSVSKSTYKLGIGFERCEDKGEKSAPKFIPSLNYHKEEEALKPNKTHYPSNAGPSFNPKREVERESPKSREEALNMLETHIVMSSLIFRLDLILVLCLALTLVLCLSSLMDLTIAHMILVHERTAL
jgi:hypothetical protein